MTFATSLNLFLLIVHLILFLYVPGGCLNVFKTTMQGLVSEFEKIRVYGHFESLPTMVHP